MFSWIDWGLILSGCGLFALTGAHQAYRSVNWAGQCCGVVEGCTDPEVIQAVGSRSE